MSHFPRTWALPAATALFLLGACSDDDPGTTTPAAPADTDAQTTSAPADGDAAQATTSEPGPSQDAAATTEPPPPADDAAQTSGGPVQAGGTVTSTDEAFTLEVPQEWEEATSEAGEGVLVGLRELERTDDFYTNLVVVTDEPVDDLEQAVADAAPELAGEEGEFELLDPVEIDGEQAFGYTLDRVAADVEVTQVQRYVEHEGVLYVLTLSSARGQAGPAAERFEELIGTWSWR